MLLLHFLVNAVKMFCPSFNLRFNIKGLQIILNDAIYLFCIFFPFLLLFCDLFYQIKIFFHAKISEGKILQFHLHPVDTQTACQRGIYFKCFPGNEFLSFLRLKFQRSHIVGSICQPYKGYPDIVGHGQHHFSEVFRLSFQLAAK